MHVEFSLTSDPQTNLSSLLNITVWRCASTDIPLVASQNEKTTLLGKTKQE